MSLFSEPKPAMGTCLSCMREPFDETPLGARRHRMNPVHYRSLYSLGILEEDEKESGKPILTKMGDGEMRISVELATARRDAKHAVEEILSLAKNDASFFFSGKITSVLENILHSLQGKGLLNYLFTLYKGAIEGQSTIPDANTLLDCVLKKAADLIMAPGSYYAAEVLLLDSPEAQPYKDCLETLRLPDSSYFFSDLITNRFWGSEEEALVRQLYGPCHGAISELKSESDPLAWSNVLFTVLAMVQSQAGAKLFMNIELQSLAPAKKVEHATVLANVLRFPMPSNSEVTAGRRRNPKKESAELPMAANMTVNLVERIVEQLCEYHFAAVLQWFRDVASKKHADNKSSSTAFLLNASLVLLSLFTTATKDFADYSSLIKILQPEFCGSMQEEHLGQFNNETQTFFLAHFYMGLFFDRLTADVGPIPYDQTAIYSHCEPLFSRRSMSQLHNFLTFTSFLLMNKIRSANPAEKYLIADFPAHAPEAFSELPKYMIENVHNGIALYLKNGRSDFIALNKGALVPLVARLYSVLLYMPNVCNLSISRKLAESLGLLVDDLRENHKLDLLPLVERDEPFASQLIPTIVRAFVFVYTPEDSQEKLQACRGLLKTFRYAWEKAKSAAMEQWKELATKEPGETAKFIEALMDNFEKVRIGLTNEFQHKEEKTRTKAKFLVSLLAAQLGAISDLTAAVPKTFVKFPTFARSLNFCLEHLTTPESADVCGEKVDAYGFDVKDMLPRLVDIYGNCQNQPGFPESLCEQGADRVLKMFQAVVDHHLADNLCNSLEFLVCFNELVEKIKAISTSAPDSRKEDTEETA